MFGCTSYFSDIEIKEYSLWLLQPSWWQSKTRSRPGHFSGAIIVIPWGYVFHMRPQSVIGDHNFSTFLFIWLIYYYFLSLWRWEWLLWMERNASNMAIKSTNSLPFFVLIVCYWSLPHLCLIGFIQILSTKAEMYILNTGVFDSFPFPRARLLN